MLKVGIVNVFAGCTGPVSAHRGRPEESKGGSGDEEPANSWPGEEDLSFGESGKLQMKRCAG